MSDLKWTDLRVGDRVRLTNITSDSYLYNFVVNNSVLTIREINVRGDYIDIDFIEIRSRIFEFWKTSLCYTSCYEYKHKPSIVRAHEITQQPEPELSAADLIINSILDTHSVGSFVVDQDRLQKEILQLETAFILLEQQIRSLQSTTLHNLIFNSGGTYNKINSGLADLHNSLQKLKTIGIG